MLAPLPPADSRSVFQDLLHGALVRGHTTVPACALGPRTLAAIDAIAQEHPEASAALIADAYDAFRREHIRVAPVEPIG